MNPSAKIFKFINKSILSGHLLNHVGPIRISQTLGSRRMLMAASVYKSQKKKDEFHDTLPGIIQTLVNCPKLVEVPNVARWIEKVLDYNLRGGKKIRGLTVIFAYEMVAKPEQLSEEDLKLVRILGWCLELLHTYFLVIDDIMDGSSTRRGRTCWYRQPDVGFGALNDSVLIYASMYEVLRTYFGKSPHYASILNIINECLLYTSSGQHLDYTMAKRNKNDYDLFTIEHYNTIVKYKTAIYTIYLPVALGLTMADVTDNKMHMKIKDICLNIGRVYQIQDDYLDCFGDESLSGKVGTDIQEGKCTWLAVTALQRCNKAQRAEFKECYGSKDVAHVERIKQLYRTLELPEIHAQFEKSHYEAIEQQAGTLPANMSQLFIKLADMLNQRKS